MIYKSVIKRIIDLVLSLIGLLILSPIFLMVFIVLATTTRDHLFFLQSRPGKFGRIFKVIKFKTMSEKRDYKGELLPDSQRLTNIGRFLRRTSLDEIPQLINVIIGDMSLIGPRPLLVEYLPRYSEFQKRRHEVRPGITGWAQVNGRNTINWEEKFLYDVWYIDHISFFLDLKIIWLTIKKVLISDGINQKNGFMMEMFKGTGGQI